MEREEIEPIVAELELATNTINQLNFKLEGLQEEVSGWEEKMPKVFARRIDVNKRKINRLMKEASTLSIEKERLEAVVNSYRMEVAEKEKKEEEAKAEKKRIAAEKRKATIARKKAQRNEKV